MDICKSLFSPGFILTEAIAREVFEVLPDSGPLIVIMDTDVNIKPSNPEQFAKLNISESFLGEICVSIDDGAEPVVTNSNNCILLQCGLKLYYHNNSTGGNTSWQRQYESQKG